MAKIQTRKTVSISGQAYLEFRAACQRNGVSMSALVQGWAEQYAARHSEDPAAASMSTFKPCEQCGHMTNMRNPSSEVRCSAHGGTWVEAPCATVRPAGVGGLVFTTRPDAPAVMITAPKSPRRGPA